MKYGGADLLFHRSFWLLASLTFSLAPTATSLAAFAAGGPRDDREQVQLFNWQDLSEGVFNTLQTCSAEAKARMLCDLRRQEQDKEARLCRCDSDCAHFGDCCFDLARNISHQKLSGFDTVPKCLPYAGNSIDLAYLVNDCPRKGNDEGDRSLRSRCHGTDMPRTYHIDLPVKAVVRGTTHEAGRKRLLTFANVFCALCNGIPHRDIRPLNAGLACNNLDIVRDCGLSILGDIVAPRNYVSGSLRWTLFLNSSDPMNNCTDQFYTISCWLVLNQDDEDDVSSGRDVDKDGLETTGGHRECLDILGLVTGRTQGSDPSRSLYSYVDQCSNDMVGGQQFDLHRRMTMIGELHSGQPEYLCNLYSLPVVKVGDRQQQYQPITIYRNPHCAACNGISLNRTTCLADLPSLKASKGPEIDEGWPGLFTQWNDWGSVSQPGSLAMGAGIFESFRFCFWDDNDPDEESSSEHSQAHGTKANVSSNSNTSHHSWTVFSQGEETYQRLYGEGQTFRKDPASEFGHHVKPDYDYYFYGTEGQSIEGPQHISTTAPSTPKKSSSSSSFKTMTEKSPYHDKDRRGERPCCRCEDLMQFWDPIYRRCYSVSCSFLYSNVAGHCLYRNLTRESLLGFDGSMMNKDGCRHMITLHPWELREFANGTILHKRLGSLYHIGEYEVTHFIEEAGTINKDKGVPWGGVVLPPDEVSLQHQRQYRVCAKGGQEPLILLAKFPGGGQWFQATTWMSLFFIGLHIFIYTSLKKLRDRPSQHLLAMMVANFSVQLLLTVDSLTYSESHSICVFIASLLHYLQLVVAFWFNVMSLDITLSLFCQEVRVDPNSLVGRLEGTLGEKVRFRIYSVYAWGIPMAVVAAGHIADHVDLLADYRPDYAGRLCWINSKQGFGAVFALPLGLLILENVVCFFIGSLCLAKSRMGLDKDGGLDPTVQNSPTVKNSTTLLSGIHQIQAVSIGVVASSLQDSSELPPKAPFLDLRARGRVRQRLANRFLRNSALGLVMTLSWLSAISAVLTDVAELWHTYVFAHGVQGIAILLLYDLKVKVYYVAYEKLMGRPHPSLKRRKQRELLSLHKMASSVSSVSINRLPQSKPPPASMAMQPKLSKAMYGIPGKGDATVTVGPRKGRVVDEGRFPPSSPSLSIKTEAETVVPKKNSRISSALLVRKMDDRKLTLSIPPLSIPVDSSSSSQLSCKFGSADDEAEHPVPTTRRTATDLAGLSIRRRSSSSSRRRKMARQPKIHDNAADNFQKKCRNNSKTGLSGHTFSSSGEGSPYKTVHPTMKRKPSYNSRHKTAARESVCKHTALDFERTMEKRPHGFSLSDDGSGSTFL